MSRQSERRHSLIQRTTFDRLRWEYAALPGMRLTLAQAERLCGVNRVQCSAVLDALIKARFLTLTIDGMYAAGDRIEPQSDGCVTASSTGTTPRLWFSRRPSR